MIDDNDFTSSNPLSTPSPTSTPTPGSAPIDYQTATTYRLDNSDGSYDIMDAINGGRLYRVYPNGRISISIYDKAPDGSNVGLTDYSWIESNVFDISNVSYDDRTATITVKNSNGNLLCKIKNKYIIESYSYDYRDDSVDIKKYDKNGVYLCHEKHKNGITTVYSIDEIKTKTIFEDGSYEVYENGNTIEYDSNNNKIKTIFPDGSYETYEDGKTIEYNVHGEKCYYLLEDGKKVYLYSDEENLILYPDGTFYNHKEGKKGRYTIASNGSITCIDDDGNTYLYDSYGKITQKIDNTGKMTTYGYNYDTMTETINQNGKEMVSMINHIEYDEEGYHHILEVLNNISNDNYRSINTSCSDIDDKIKSFPDSYSGGMVSEIGKSIKSNIDLIGSLSKMTNYSLLAYQACDNSLKEKLNSLIDSLFDNKEGGEGFKKLISSFIEDRDNDGILEYKLDTDFDYVYNNLMPTQKYVDENGNIIYFNNLGKLLTADGNNIKINYGGEDFTLTFGANGCAILRDSNGNPIDIFGDYNIPSEQYGGNQKTLFENASKLLQDRNINTILDRYCPGATYEEKLAYLHNIGYSGCGFVALTNMSFKMMEGHEEDFQNNFGYPMYDLFYQDGSVSVDYNYEPLVVELFSEAYKTGWAGENRTIKEMTRCSGITECEEYKLEYYLMNKYHIYDYNPDQKFVKIGCQNGYNLFDSNNVLADTNYAHAVTLTDRTNLGETYVSSWGKKYRLEKGEDGWLLETEYPLAENSSYDCGIMGYSTEHYTVDVGYIKENDNATLTVRLPEEGIKYRVIYHDWHDGDEDCFTFIKDGE